MPTYEMMLLLRVMPKIEVCSTLKRTAEAIFEKGGIIRSLQNLGTKDMPYKTSVHGTVHRKASYFVLEFNVPPNAIADLSEFYGRDVDIIRRRLFKIDNKKTPSLCTLEEENKPPPYRKEVEVMLEQSKKRNKTNFKYNSGLDYYPFQK